MAKTVYFDCFSGVSGDMSIGALLDLGLPLDDLRGALGSLALDYGDVSAARVMRAGVASTKFHVHERTQERQHDHGHDHHHHHHQHHSLAEIEGYIRRSSLSAAGKDRAVAMFERLARAEAAIHDMPLDKVHLHEVGAIDSIIDIVGVVHGMEALGAASVVSSPLNVGSGTVECAHGTFPVPAPATAMLLQGVPIYSGAVAMELVTPTGALIVTEFASRFGPIPPMRVDNVGYGAGDRDVKAHPNVLRILTGREEAASGTEQILSIECEIDDMNPQLFGPLMDRLHAAGALDVFYAAVQMKKNRPGTLVTVLAPPSKREALSALLFAETTTIGLRYQEMVRECLDREIRTIETPIGPIRFKIARRNGQVLNAAPEFDDCAKAASDRKISIKDAQAIATKAWLDSGR